MNTIIKLQKLLDEIHLAGEVLIEASKAYKIAANEELIARNVLNRLQQEFDKTVESCKAESAAGSNWKRRTD